MAKHKTGHKTSHKTEPPKRKLTRAQEIHQHKVRGEISKVPKGKKKAASKPEKKTRSLFDFLKGPGKTLKKAAKR